VVTFAAPGGDLMCGRAQSYEVVTSRRWITADNFDRARPLRVTLVPSAAGSPQALRLPRRVLRYVAIRALDSAGNVGRPMLVKVRS
jgi:hypothetical protein